MVTVLVSCDKNTMTKSEVYLVYTFMSQFIKGTQDRNLSRKLEVGTEVEAMED